MSAAPALLQQTRDAARRRRIAIVLAASLPLWLALLTVAWRFGNVAITAAVGVVGVLALAAFAWRCANALDRRWLVRELDARRVDMDDSSDLLFADPSALNPLERLQLARLQHRLATAPAPDFRAPWPLRALAASALLAALLIAITALWPVALDQSANAPLPGITAATPAATHVKLLQQQLEIEPPAYTRLPKRAGNELDARAPEGARLRWRLRFDPAPDAATIVFLDGRRFDLRREGDDWTATATFDRSGLYRIVPAGALPLLPDRLHRIDVIRDRPPQIRVAAPDRNLTLRAGGQRQWALAFEASDDYGVAANAQLRITTAQGTGENITFREQTRSVAGSGSRTRKRYAHRLDLDALALAEGDDVVVQFAVSDNRAGSPQTMRSASYILRWPLPQAETETGLEGLMKKTLPAYFRSQRQVIIDAEALLKEKPKLAQDAFVQRSDGIGVDQRLLRLRYGQFLGEESEGAPQRPLLPTNDAEAETAEHARTDDAGHDHDHDHDGDRDADDDAAHAREAAAGTAAAETGSPQPPDPHAHDHEATPDAAATQGFGRAEDVLEEFGHTHDLAEAATLLDPETRTTLRAALDQMWQSELNLRQGRPDAALPFAYKALDFIKQVQQASRIYLARVGYEQAPVDESRRLTGKREGLASRRSALGASDTGDPEPAALWRTLQDASRDEDMASGVAAFADWLRRNEARVDDLLALFAALDALQRTPDCDDCRRRLRALLWPLLTPPPAAPAPRRAPDRDGQAYLDALQRASSQ
jgi:hypothetical protein